MDSLSRCIWEAIEDYMGGVHIMLPGVVVKYDPKTRHADIQPSIKRKMPNGTFMELPIIPEVPVRYSGNKEYTIHFPLKPGDEVFLNVIERCTDTWKGKGGDGIEETDLRRFDIQDCIAITGGAPIEFIPVLEEGLNIVHHKKDPKGEWISTITMDDDKIRLKYKQKSEVLMEDDKIKCTTEGNTFTMTGKHVDTESPNPIGIKGTGTQLGGDVLQEYFGDEKTSWSKNPVIIPPIPLLQGMPLLPIPPFICMFLKARQIDYLAADNKAKISCAKALK